MDVPEFADSYYGTSATYPNYYIGVLSASQDNIYVALTNLSVTRLDGANQSNCAGCSL